MIESPDGPVTPQTPSPEPAGTSTPPGSSGAAAPAPEYRFGAAPDVPAWAQGKTAKEVLEIGKNLYSIAERFNQTGQVQAPAQPQYQSPQQGYQYQPPAQAPVEIGDDEFLTGRQVKQFVSQQAQALAPQFQQSVNLAAQTTLGLVQQKYTNEFQRYGPEIQGYLANLPREAWSLDNLERVVKIVRAEHLDELVDERARQRATEMIPSLRPNGGATESPSASGYESKVPADWLAKAKSVGLGEAEIRDFCAANRMTPDQFFKQFDGGLITAAVAESKPRTVVR